MLFTKFLKRVYLDVQVKMEQAKIESLLNKFDAEGAHAFSDEVVEILEKRNEAEFSTAVSVTNKHCPDVGFE